MKEHILNQTVEKKSLLHNSSKNLPEPKSHSKESSSRLFSFISSFFFTKKRKRAIDNRNNQQLKLQTELHLEKQFQESFSPNISNGQQSEQKQNGVFSQEMTSHNVTVADSQLNIETFESKTSTDSHLPDINSLSSTEEFQKRYKFWNYTVDGKCELCDFVC